MLKWIRDKVQGKIPSGKKRSKKWGAVRAEHLKRNPVCAVCGSKKTLEVHHIVPFHLRPDLELELSNLITLCESKTNGIVCHRAFGHLGNYSSFNSAIREDAETWSRKFKERPKRG